MRRLVISSLVCTTWALMASVQPAAAQLIGTFSWQTQPNCNIVTLNVTQAGSDYLLEGFDDLCGAVRRAPVTGTATLNPNGTVGLGLVVVGVPGGEPTHIDAAVSLPSLNGTWSDSGGFSGTFVFNGAGGGAPRQVARTRLTGFAFDPPAVTGRRAFGAPSAPFATIVGSTLLTLAARGHTGTDFSLVDDAAITLGAAQSFVPGAHGTRIDFATTANGTTAMITRMRIDHDGQIGIGSISPSDRLDVAGNVRVGTGALGCVRDRDADVIAGTCASDARFKQNVVSFEPMLNKVAALRPVHFYWRADEFPRQAFGSQQSYGLMAHEVEEVLPELVKTDAEGFKAVNYSKLPLLAIQAIKDLKVENDDLKVRLALIERRLARVEADRK